ncbi:protein 4.1-like [Octopus sinensis]|uniref:Protein 4.1-like n=1 Tax=Octopus sinensis TaxID=2607531 RepID=A0A6P7UAJ1_9MOLL|nr:protein 4.1-like [Octopus sinensis]
MAKYGQADQRCLLWSNILDEIVVFGVKYYPPDPTKVGNELTKYMLCLQLRKDIEENKIECSFGVQILLASYCLQSELGEYQMTEDYQKKAINYVLMDNPSMEYLATIREAHKMLNQLTNTEADVHFLDIVRKLPRYSFEFFEGEVIDGLAVTFGVGCIGIVIYLDSLRMFRFTWLKIVKLSYRGLHFIVKFGQKGKYTTQTYRMKNQRQAKSLWKRSVDNHVFFRLTVNLPSRKGILNTLKTDQSLLSFKQTSYSQDMNRGITNNTSADTDLRRAVLKVTQVPVDVFVEEISSHDNFGHSLVRKCL